jgi:hypothetical protein
VDTESVQLSAVTETRNNTGTKAFQATPLEINNHRIFLVDTPGLGSSNGSDFKALAKFLGMLLAHYKNHETALQGIIYLHSLTGPSSSMKALDRFKQLCTSNNRTNIVLATTYWDSIPTSEGVAKEKELREGVWNDMMAEGAVMGRYVGSEESAIEIVGSLFNCVGSYGTRNIVGIRIIGYWERPTDCVVLSLS